jgi:hypothetical protein
MTLSVRPADPPWRHAARRRLARAAPKELRERRECALLYFIERSRGRSVNLVWIRCEFAANLVRAVREVGGGTTSAAWRRQGLGAGSLGACLGLYPIVTSQHSSTTSYQVSYHIEALFSKVAIRFIPVSAEHPDVKVRAPAGRVLHPRGLPPSESRERVYDACVR